MGALKIPEEYQLGISKIRGLPDREFEELVSVLRDSPSIGRRDELMSRINTKLSTVPTQDIEQIWEALNSLAVVREGASVSLAEFVEDVSDGMEEIPSEKLRLRHEERPQFKKRLKKLLSVDAFSVLAKARALLVEHQRDICTARILTDIRPVFGSDVADPPKAAVIVHTLKISYHESNELKDFFVAMDTEDVIILKDLIARAERKAENLRSLLRAANITCIEPRNLRF